ncbi:MAG: hypothetical protein PHS60_13250, partial [Zavarzinia sp.]|nr:hypothetical protein [Zavarzinia sp.]
MNSGFRPPATPGLRSDAEGVLRLGLDGAEAMLALLETSHLEILEALQPFWLRGTSPLAPAARLAYRAGRALNGVVARGLRLGLSALPPIPPLA